MLKALLIKFVLGLVMPGVVAAVKAAAPGVWSKVPDWLRPLLSSVLGAVASGGTSLVTDAAAGAVSIAVDAAAGAAGGASGKALRDSAKAMKMPWMEGGPAEG